MFKKLGLRSAQEWTDTSDEVRWEGDLGRATWWVTPAVLWAKKAQFFVFSSF